MVVIFQIALVVLLGFGLSGCGEMSTLAANLFGSDATYSLSEDSSVDITLESSSSPMFPISYELLSAPQNGKLEGTAPQLKYTPEENYNGSDFFEFKLTSGAEEHTVRIALTVLPVNDAPVATPLALQTQEDTAVTARLAAVDLDRDDLVYSIVASPQRGVATLSPSGQLQYTPNLNVSGSDTLTFIARDGAASTPPTTVTITVNAVNDAPVVSGYVATTNEETPVATQIIFSDAENDPVTLSLVTPPSRGTVTLAANGVATYVPQPNTNGSDQFTFRASDGTSNSAVVTARINISPVNDRPSAISASATVVEDGELARSLGATDIDGDAVTFALRTRPSRGTLTLNSLNGNYTYRPNANTNGSDSFSFVVSDGSLESAVANVVITVTPVEDKPVAAAFAVSMNEDTVSSGQLVASDGDGDRLTFRIVSQPTNGSVSTDEAGRFSFTPDLDYSGTDAFRFEASDGKSVSNVATANVTIAPLNATAPDKAVVKTYTYQPEKGRSHSVIFKYSDLLNRAIAHKDQFPGDKVEVNLALYKLSKEIFVGFNPEDSATYGRVSGHDFGGSNSEKLVESIRKANEEGVEIRFVFHNPEEPPVPGSTPLPPPPSPSHDSKGIYAYLGGASQTFARRATWGLTGSQQMHNKFLTMRILRDDVAISHAVYISTANGDPFNPDFTPAWDVAQTGILVRSHEKLHDAFAKYFNELWKYANHPQGIEAFQDAVIKLHHAGALNYEDPRFQAFFFPMPSAPAPGQTASAKDFYGSAWVEKYNPIARMVNKLAKVSGDRYVKFNSFWCGGMKAGSDPFTVKLQADLSELYRTRGTRTLQILTAFNNRIVGDDPICPIGAFDGGKIAARTHEKNYLFTFGGSYYSITGSVNLITLEFREKANSLLVIRETADRPIYLDLKEAFYNAFNGG